MAIIAGCGGILKSTPTCCVYETQNPYLGI